MMLVLVMMIQESEAAKGGAKSVINRNRRQRNRGGHGIGGHHGDDNMVDRGENLNLKHIVKDNISFYPGGSPITGMGDWEKRPCIGVCYYIKKRGIKLSAEMKARMKRRRPCIGLCHKKKMKAIKKSSPAAADKQETN